MLSVCISLGGEPPPIPESTAEPGACFAQNVFMQLSVIIPVYNERRTLPAVLVAVCAALPAVRKEIIIVDDGSSDGTREWLRANLPDPAVTTDNVSLSDDGALCVAGALGQPMLTFIPIFRDKNGGKGAALRSGFAVATGDVIVVQDADLEYDPTDWERMFPLIATRHVADVVFGSRFYGQPHRSLNFHHYLANRLISSVFNLLFNQTLTDIEVCYKMMTASVLRSLRLSSDDFGIEVEMSAEIARQRHLRIYEIGIAYYGRSYAEGKKIGWRDGLKAIWYLFKFRFRSQSTVIDPAIGTPPR